MWTRGSGCGELAELLATEAAIRADRGPARSCLDHCADLAVMAGGGSFDVVPTANPIDFDPDRVRFVVGAVAGGPHSRLASVVAARVAGSLGVPGEVVSGFRTTSGAGIAAAAVADGTASSGLPGRIEEVSSAADLAATFPPGTLLVLGAPGGSWLHRQFLGPGQRLTAAATAGAVVVRSQPLRAFHRMQPLTGISTHIRVADARLVAEEQVQAVIDEGRLVGVVRMSSLASADPDSEVGAVMEQVPLASAYDALADLRGLEEFFEGSPIPVVDKRGRLVGGVEPDDLSRAGRLGSLRYDNLAGD